MVNGVNGTFSPRTRDACEQVRAGGLAHGAQEVGLLNFAAPVLPKRLCKSVSCACGVDGALQCTVTGGQVDGLLVERDLGGECFRVEQLLLP